MNEWKYSASPCPFPTLARGLFTEWMGSGDGTDQLKKGKDEQDGYHRIVARGYDKFFNMNEVRWNTVSHPLIEQEKFYSTTSNTWLYDT